MVFVGSLFAVASCSSFPCRAVLVCLFCLLFESALCLYEVVSVSCFMVTLSSGRIGLLLVPLLLFSLCLFCTYGCGNGRSSIFVPLLSRSSVFNCSLRLNSFFWVGLVLFFLTGTSLIIL